MKRPRSVLRHPAIKTLLVITVLLFVATCHRGGPAESQTAVEQHSKKIFVIGHRGAAGLAPENTLAAFGRACEIGVDAFELDVLLTADREVVVHHDFHLKPEIARTPDGKWLQDDSPPVIKNLKLAELKTYDVGRLKPYTGYSRRYPEQIPVDGQRIPTLGEVIQLFKKKCDRNTQMWVEIKTSPEKPEMTPEPEVVADAVIEILRNEKVSQNASILSFDWRVLVHVQKIAPQIPTVYLSHVGVRLNNIKPGQAGASRWMAGIDVDKFKGSIPQSVNAAGGRYWAPHYTYVTTRRVREAHRLGIQVFVWTPDSSSDMKRLIGKGVDGIITNRPDILQSIRNKPKSK
ncbi:MAG: glycerophosphodiester phosphodiesterase [Desulfobacterales bacterium]